MAYQVKRLQPSDLDEVKELLLIFAQAFENKTIGMEDVPDDTYLRSLLERSDVHVLVALDGTKVIGGLTGYEFPLATKKEKELYLYDLAVDEKYRRQGVARSLINELKAHAKKSGVSLIIVEAESKDLEAVEFYKALGAEQLTVEHFNIETD